MEFIWIILLPILVFLVFWPLAFERTWQRFFLSLLFNTFGIALPLFVFAFSSAMVPEWKGACHFGWLSCFIGTKLALSPIVLLASAALYRIEILPFQPPAPRWVEIGLFLGAIVATVCTVYGVVVLHEWKNIWFWLWMSVPFYVSVWYGVRTKQFLRTSDWGIRTYLYSLLGSLPFWLWSCWWSFTTYEKLPENAPDCFVVTAAGRGHRGLVGPFTEFSHGGRRLAANRQLITFWTLEDRWRVRSPGSHRLFRRAYNRLGPHLARRIRSPWLADAVWLALKPLELLAKLACGK